MGKIVAVTGNTGVGKTSLVHALAKNGDFNIGIEQHANRPFQAVLKTNQQYALANQIDYLLLRAEQEASLRKSPVTGIVDGGLDQDFYCFSRLFKARLILGEAEFELCRRFYDFCRSQLPPPDLIIHLSASPEILKIRLAGRERINIATIDDISLLETYLEEMIDTFPPEKVILLDVSALSPSYSEVLVDLKNQIFARLKLDAGKYDTLYIP